MILHCNPDKPNSDAIRRAAEILRSGGVVIYPTDTVYGMGCDMMNSRAWERLCRIGGLDPGRANPSFLFYDLSHLADYTRPVPNHIFREMKKLLPGPVTFILESNNRLPGIFRNRKKTIGIRVPDNLIIRELVKELGNPILNTSVRDAEDEVTEHLSDPDRIHDLYGDKVELVLAGGYGGLHTSRVLDCTGGDVKVIRE
ncbi:MAG: threonylcarbamoyl-AMP synthase [Bacteroidia bacterium]|nr:threonylcarbamoyl-AMP synthase [Bacteroidia bacterium]